MNAKRTSAVFVMCIITIVTSIISVQGIMHRETILTYFKKRPTSAFFSSVENIVGKLMPYGENLKQLSVGIKYRSGMGEQDGIFISDNYLLKNISPPVESISNGNTSAIKSYASTYRVPTYIMLIPTSCAINQQDLNLLSSSQLYNQKSYIEDTYRKLQGNVSTVNAYPTLFANNDKHLYYKTESNLTSTGGYYVYKTLAARLNLTPHPLNRYEIEHLNKEFYGDIYNRSPYKSISPDQISLYHFTKYKREYLINSTDTDGIKTFHNLYPKETYFTGDPTDIFLGGNAQMIDILSSSPYDTKLLIYGDKTTLTYIPFLAPHFKNITFLDPTTATAEIMNSVDIKSYDQIVFAFSVDTYMHENVIPKRD